MFPEFTFYWRIIADGVGLVDVGRHLRPVGLELEELGYVEANGKAQDGDDVVAGGPGLGVVVKRVTNGEISGTKEGKI